MIATDNGFVYNIETKTIIAEIFIGNRVEIPTTSAIFYGTKQQALDYGLQEPTETEMA